MNIQQDGSLLRFTLRLTLRGPVFVGSGEKLGKKEYCFNQGTVYFYNMNDLFRCIVDNGKVEEFEAYMADPDARTLNDFFKANGGYALYGDALIAKMPGGDAIIGAGGQPADIWLFQHDKEGRPYLPGSSVKGMLRTAITAARLLEEPPETPKPQPGTDRRAVSEEAKKVEKKLDTELFHTLGADEKKRSNAVNSVFRGLSVGDSQPLSLKDFVLCRKIDLLPSGQRKPLNVVRQCLRPGISVDLPVTMDTTLCGALTPQGILDAIDRFDAWYEDNVFSHYPKRSFPMPQKHGYLFLGGGAGFPSKTVTGPWLGEDSLPYVARWLTAQFGKKNASDEYQYQFSPHMLKCTEVNGVTKLFGLCEVSVL